MQRLLFIIVFVFQSSVSLTSAQNSKFNYIYQEAVRQKQAQNYSSAFELFNYCLKLHPESAATLYELSELNRFIHMDSLSIKYMEKACLLEPSNYWYKDRLVSLYYNDRRIEDTQRTLEDMAQQFPEKEELLMKLLEIYERNENYTKMIDILNKLEVKEGKSEMISMEKFNTYLKMEDEKNAFREIQELANEYPNDFRYQVVLGDLYLDSGKPDEAYHIFKEIEAKDSTNVTLQLAMSSYYQHTGQDSLYSAQLKKMLTNPNLDNDTRVRLMRGIVIESITQKTDSTETMDLISSVLQMPQETTEIHEICVRYMVTKGFPRDMIRPYLAEMLEIDPECDMARQESLSYAIQDNNMEDVVSICKPAVEYNTDNPVYYYYMGVGCYQTHKLEEAIECFKKAVEHSSGSEDKLTILTNSYSLMGELYHVLGNDNKMYQAYDSCLIYKSNDITVLNNYAYYLSLNKKDLKKAEEMSRKCNEIEPNNPTYLDTYAWVLYQMKRYDEAKEIIDKCIELSDPEELKEDSDIQQHIIMINNKAKKNK